MIKPDYKENLQKKSGIYLITNLINNHKYVGSSKDMGKRITQHKVDLRRNKHHSPYLQRAWNKYGELNFDFSCIEFCDISCLIEREQFYIDSINPEYNVGICASSSMSGRTHTEDTKNKIKDRLHSIFSKDDFIARAKHANSFVSDESRKKNSDRLQNKEIRIRAIERSKEVSKTMEHRIKLSESHKHYTDEIRKRFSNAQKRLWSNDEYRSRASISRRGKGRALHTLDDVKNIRNLHFNFGMSAREISENLDESYHTIRSILYNNWKWLDE